MDKPDEKIIDIADLASEVLRSWTTVLLITICMTLLAGVFGAYRGWKSANTVIEAEEYPSEIVDEEYETMLQNARALLTSEEADEVERLNEQMKSYVEYRKQYQKKFTSYLNAGEETGDEHIIKRISYRFISSLQGAENMMTVMSLSIDDYKKIMEILPGADTVDDAYNYLSLWSVDGTVTRLSNFGEDSVVIPSDHLIVVELIGNNKEICDQIDDVVYTALEKEASEIQSVDSSTSLERLGSQYRGNLAEYIANRRQSTFDYIQKIDTTINNLKTYAIDKLPDNQKNYYNILKDLDYGSLSVEEQEIPIEEEKTVTLINRKMIVAGFFFGLILAFIVILIKYVMNGTLKVNREIENYYHISVIGSFFTPGERRGLFSGLIRKLCGVDDVEPERRTELIAADVCGMLRKEEGDSLYLIRTSENGVDQKIAGSIGKAVAENDTAYHVESGLPLDDPEDLGEITEYRNALLLVHNRQTLQKDVEKLLDLCKRHSIKILGAVTINEA